MIATSIEQSKELVRLGLYPATSDMWWIDDQLVAKSDMFDVPSNDEETTVYCAWSLSALLEVMPSFIDYKDQKLRLTIEKAGIWNVFYLGTKHRINEIWFNGEYGNPVEPAYKMVCWLLENNLIKKGGQDGRD